MQGQYWKTSGRATANMLAGDEDASSVKIPAFSSPIAGLRCERNSIFNSRRRGELLSKPI
jgi:hypothetical protein